jgi:hypothetical protein
MCEVDAGDGISNAIDLVHSAQEKRITTMAAGPCAFAGLWHSGIGCWRIVSPVYCTARQVVAVRLQLRRAAAPGAQLWGKSRCVAREQCLYSEYAHA